MVRPMAEALRLLGFGEKPSVAIEKVRFEPRRVAIGGSVSMSFVLRSKSHRTQDLLVDAAVHFVKAYGSSAPKVFKLKRVTLGAGEIVEFSKQISLAVHTTRKPNAGKHAVEVIINGTEFAIGSFDVTPT